MAVSLHELRLTEEHHGKVTNVLALDSSRLEDIRFVSYIPPPTDLSSDNGQLEEWGDRIRFNVQDLHRLLQLNHDKFWCQAIYDETLQNLIDTYLRNAPRSHDVMYDLPEDFQEQHEELHKLIFMTCLRLATHKEDKEHFITPTVFGEIIYENFIFDIPKLYDMCVLYGQGNGQLLSKMIANIFSQQPKYNEDLSCVIPIIYQVFEDMKKKCGLPISSRDGKKSPLKLSSANGTQEKILENINIPELQDLIFYLADIGMTLSSFLEVYPQASHIFQQANFVVRLSESYDLVPVILAAIKNKEFESYHHKQLLQRKLAQAKKSLMKAVHLIINHCFLESILENRDSPDSHVEGFIQMFSAVLNERQFLADFESCHPFQDYSDILTQCPCDVDETRLQYIQDACSSAFATYGKRRKPTGATTRGGRTSPDGSPGPMKDDSPLGAMALSAQASNDVDNYDALGACAPRKTGVELESMIASVKDLLPDLGDGFIEICLEETEYDIEKVINFVLEDKLPPSLQNVDRQLPRKLPTQPEDSVISQRANVFDHDEFDVYSRDNVDMSRVHKGKRGKTDTMDLYDKDMAALKPKLTEKYGYQVHVEEVDDISEVYDDEYDDTYDTVNVGADDDDSADELSQRRQFTVPRVLQTRRDRAYDNVESSEESDEETPVKDEFVPNPALIRQRAEERAQWKAQRKAQGQKTQFKGQQHAQNQEKKYDVKGAPKGKGQSGEVLKNRAWKDKHKSSQANHSRKYFADKKRMGFGGPPK